MFGLVAAKVVFLLGELIRRLVGTEIGMKLTDVISCMAADVSQSYHIGAPTLMLCEPQLKPFIENQAIARCYRMGQARKVLVFRLLCEDTIDERITDILKSKTIMFDEFADISVSGEECLRLIEEEQNKKI
ncbi:MAG: DEAD/DEAH box helicase [Clostridia bacterium]|nr:DEAD/DEAH box helicase [Clostridia bacterium]